MNPWDNYYLDPGMVTGAIPNRNAGTIDPFPIDRLGEDWKNRRIFDAGTPDEARMHDARHPPYDVTFSDALDAYLLGSPFAKAAYRGLRGLGEEGALRVMRDAMGRPDRLESYVDSTGQIRGVADIAWPRESVPLLSWLNTSGPRGTHEIWKGLQDNLTWEQMNNLQGTPLNQAMPFYRNLAEKGRLDKWPDLKQRALDRTAGTTFDYTYKNPMQDNPLKGQHPWPSEGGTTFRDFSLDNTAYDSLRRYLNTQRGRPDWMPNYEETPNLAAVMDNLRPGNPLADRLKGAINNDLERFREYYPEDPATLSEYVSSMIQRVRQYPYSDLPLDIPSMEHRLGRLVGEAKNSVARQGRADFINRPRPFEGIPLQKGDSSQRRSAMRAFVRGEDPMNTGNWYGIPVNIEAMSPWRQRVHELFNALNRSYQSQGGGIP